VLFEIPVPLGLSNLLVDDEFDGAGFTVKLYAITSTYFVAR
jgi:hypothetical protein